MKDLNRLLDDPGTDPLELDLLRLAKSDGPSGESRRRILAGLGVGVAAGTLAASSNAAQPRASAVASSAAVKWGVAGVVAIGASVVAFLSLQPKAPSVAPPAAISTPAAAPVTAPTVPATGTDAAPVAPVTKLEDLPTLADGPSTDTSKTTATPSLADEVAAIRSAKGALASGNAAQALHELDAYRAHFPHGRLAQEATVVRIEALINSGNSAAAGAIADRFLAAHADSPYSARVRSLTGR